MKKNETKKINKTKKQSTKKISDKKTLDKKILDKQISIFTVMFIVLAICVVIGVVFGIRYLVINLKYKTYTDKMKTYGLVSLYNNKKATATSKVDNKELLKITVAGIVNEKRPSTFNEVKEEEYLEYMYSFPFAEEDLDKKVTRKDMVLSVTKFAVNMLSLEIEPTELKMSDSTLAKFTDDEKTLIGQAVTLGIIKNKNSAVSDKYIIKGELNKIIVTLIEKYATITGTSVVINSEGKLENQNISIVTKTSEKPTNYKEYPYIVDNIENEIYETEFANKKEYNNQTPKEVYEMIGSTYGQISETTTRYFNTILNVDYENITVENFLEEINKTSVYLLDEEDVQEYVNYVKENKIKLKGNGTAMLPIICWSGDSYLLRTKVTFEILSSNTNKNLLYMDENVTYNGKTFEAYIDIPMGMTVNSITLNVYIDNLANHIAVQNGNITVD